MPRLNAHLVLFVAAHVVCLAAFWTGVTVTDAVLAVALYGARMFGITAGYHRYFSHRSYELGRVAQFSMAWLAQSSAQKSVLWWAAHHRHHHRHSDQPTDIHSPRQRGFWYSHVGWIVDPATDATDLDKVKDLARYPELMWLHRHELVPAASVAALCFAIGGWSGLVVGFFVSTVVTWHATFTINSLSHVFGTRRYETTDDSRNNLWLALLTFGEGWHNNHHRYPGSARQGFAWYQVDLTWLALRALAGLGIARRLRSVPTEVLESGGYR